MKLASTIFFLLINAVCFSQNFEIYVSDAGNFNNPPWQILKFDENGENPITFIDSNLNWPQDIHFSEDENVVLISNLGSGRITRHDATTGAFISNFATLINGPTRIKIGPDGLLYVLQWNGNGKVLRYNLDGSFLGEFTKIGVPQSIGMDWDKNGNLYVSSYNGDLVRKFDSTGADKGAFINSNLAGPTNIWFDATGDLLVADYDGTGVKRFDADGNYIGEFLQGLKNSEGVDFFPNGDILIGNGGSSSVKLFDSNGNYLKDLIPRGAGSLLTPNAVVIRSLSPSAVKNIDDSDSIIIYPTIGKEFFITSEYSDKIESFELFNIQGKSVTNINSFDGSPIKFNVSEGAYILKINFFGGSSKLQKIFIRSY